ncbi:MAG TPA: ABC transporter substrate-binding protein [Candidatus Avamphibacillus sp.]|nr:ABC transporter substrate-binding protein [Candidatus Avamphibacillus sp.]
MKFKMKAIFMLIAFVFMIDLIGCNKESASENIGTGQPGEDPVEGGTFKVAIGSEPDSLDWMYISATATRDIAWHIFENLFALDKDFKARPMIAEGYEISNDETTYTITLRDDVLFHNGAAVSADDVVASIERWREVSSVGSITSEYIDQVQAIDKNTVEIKLNEVYNALITDMAAPKSALMIIPAEIAEDAGDKPLKQEQLIGTGPYKFDSWDKGTEIVLSRFDDYASREETDWKGLTGVKTAYADKIEFQIVKDSQVMVNGLKTGLYDYVQNISPDLYDMIESDTNMDPVTYMNGYEIISVDKSEAPFDDFKVRQALNHSLDKKSIAKGVYSNEQFYDLDGALFTPEQGELYSEKGSDNYLVHDKAEAKNLLDSSKYNGEPLTMIYSNDNETYEKIAQVAKQQMEEVGFTVKLESYEWATYLEKWMDPSNWDLVVIGWSTRFSPSELGMLELEAARSGWYESERWEDHMQTWGIAKTGEQKEEILTKMNQTISDELPFIKIANVKRFDAKRNTVKDLTNWVGPRFWNTWKSE